MGYSVTETIRDVAALKPSAQLACRLLFQECYKAGIKDIFVTETLRRQERQNYLYQQGRSRPGPIVTWTTKSNHSGGLAFDIAVAPPKSLYDESTLNKVGTIAAKLGITWGGQKSWVQAGKTDKPHFEVGIAWKPPTGYKLEGQVIVPSNSKNKVQLIVQDKKPVVEPKGEEKKMLNETARNEMREMLKKARVKGLINEKVHTDEKIANYDDQQLLSYFLTVQARLFQ